MKKEHVPQDNCKSYSGHKKLVYATDEKGHYAGVQSSGWEIEGYATEMAVQELEEQIREAKEDYLLGKISALGYYMPLLRFDVTSLSQASGFFQWQVKRHLRPEVFNKLSDKKLAVYGDILKLSIEELRHPNL